MKKLLSLITALTIVVSMFSAYTVVSADTEMEFVNDENGADMLAALGVISDIDYESDWSKTEVTRAQFVSYAVRLFGFGSESFQEVKLPYADVYLGYEYGKELSYAYVMGMLDTSDKRIRPDALADYDFAARTLTLGLGWGKYAEQTGKPMETLREYKRVTKGVKKSENLSLADAYAMFVNCLEAKVNEIVSTNGDYADYSSAQNVLQKYFDSEMVEGQIMSSSYATIDGAYSENGKININGVQCKADSKYQMMTGSYVRAIIRDYDKDGKACVTYAYKNRPNYETTFSGSDFVRFDGKSITYTDAKGSQKQISLKNTVLLYNGRNVNGNDYSDKLFDFRTGSITVYKSDSASSCIAINKYRSFIIGACDSDSYTVYAKNIDKLSVRLDTSNPDNCVSIKDTKGNSINFEDIRPGYLITYYSSIDGRVADAYVTRDTLKSRLTNIKTEGGAPSQAVVNEEVRKIADDVDAGKVNVNTADYYKVYFDIFGNIAALEISRADESGLCYLVGLKPGSGLDSKYRAKILDADCIDIEDAEISYLAEKVKIDGTQRSAEDIETALKKYNGSLELPIVAERNSKGEIFRIDTPYYDAAKEQKDSLQCVHKANTADESDKMDAKNWVVNGKYKNSLDMKYYIDINGLIVMKPTDGSDMFINNALRNDGEYWCDVYAMGADNVLSPLVVAYDSASASPVYETQAYVITGVSKTVNSKGNEVYYVTLSTGAKEIGYYVSEKYQSVAEGVSEGDIVRVALDARGEIMDFMSLLSYENRESELGQKTAAAENRILAGMVTSVLTDENGNSLIKYSLDRGNPDNFECTWLISECYIVEKSRDSVTITKADSNTVLPYDMVGSNADTVVLRYNYCNPTFMFIVR